MGSHGDRSVPDVSLLDLTPTQTTAIFFKRKQWRVVVDEKRTLQVQEIQLLIKLYRHRSMGKLISLGEPINTTLPYNKGVLSKRPTKSAIHHKSRR